MTLKLWSAPRGKGLGKCASLQVEVKKVSCCRTISKFFGYLRIGCLGEGLGAALQLKLVIHDMRPVSDI